MWSRGVAVLGVAVLIIGCNDQGPGGPEPTPEPKPAALEMVEGDGQSALPGAAVAVPPSVRVTDSSNAPVVHFPVAFAVVAGGGRVGTDTVATDSSGVAAGSWTLGSGIGINQLSASVPDLPAVTFRALATIPSTDIQGFNLNWPHPGDWWGDTAKIRLYVTSTFAIDSITGSVGSSRVTLKLGNNGWEAGVPLLAEPYGPNLMVITAWDVHAARRDTAIAIFHDAPPRITVTTPDEGAVAWPPSLTVNASCWDDNPGGCEFFQARIGVDTTVATGTTGLNFTVPLAERLGRQLTLYFVAREPRGRQIILYRHVYVANPAHLALVQTYETAVQDVKGDRALHYDAVNWKLSITQGTSAPVTVTTAPKVGSGRLTDNGAVWIKDGSTFVPDSLFEYRNGVTSNLGPVAGEYGLAVSGGFVAWTRRRGVTAVFDLMLRDVMSGSTVLADSGMLGAFDVTAAGDLYYWLYNSDPARNYKIARYRAGTSSIVSRDSVMLNSSPLTDGTRVVYRRTSRDDVNKWIVLEDGTGELALTPAVRRSSLEPFVDYQINAGWVAFTTVNAGDGSIQVGVRSPAGAVTQVGTFAGSSAIEALGDDGSVVFTHSGKRYLAPPGGGLTDLGDINGRLIWRDGRFLLLIGSSVYRIVP